VDLTAGMKQKEAVPIHSTASLDQLMEEPQEVASDTELGGFTTLRNALLKIPIHCSCCVM